MDSKSELGEKFINLLNVGIWLFGWVYFFLEHNYKWLSWGHKLDRTWGPGPWKQTLASEKGVVVVVVVVVVDTWLTIIWQPWTRARIHWPIVTYTNGKIQIS